MKRIVILGGGFAGLWSAVGAARKLAEAGVLADSVEVVLVNTGKHHCIRVRNYEAALEPTRVPLAQVLDPIGVRLVEGEASGIDVTKALVSIRTSNDTIAMPYDKLIVAIGSQLIHPPIPGLKDFAFDIDTYHGAKRLQDHIERLASAASTEGQFTAIVVGAGLTGVELATELPERLKAAARSATGAGKTTAVRTILADRAPLIAQAMGEAQPVIEKACKALGVELWPNFALASVDAAGVTLADGNRVAASTVVWCGGMHAHPLVECLPVSLDSLGRAPVDHFMRMQGLDNVFAAGDAAHALIDGEHASVMSCQHARPMGRFAGHNAASEILGLPMLALDIDWYTTVLDLGPWGAVYTEGWERRLVAEGEVAKRTKMIINHERIYPPKTNDKMKIFESGAPVVQRPPTYGTQAGIK